MKSIVLSALAVLCLLAPVEAATLLERYEKFVPLHLKAEIPMPTPVCRKLRAWGKEQCHYESKLEISPSFEQLLADIEKSHDTTDAKFLATPLGKHYQGAKRFVEIQKDFSACQESAAWGTKGNLRETLGRLSTNVSQSYLDEDCNACYESGELLPSEFLSFADDLESATSQQQNLESTLHLEFLKGSLEARIAYAQKFRGKNIQADSFKQQLLGELCRKDSKSFCNDGERAILERLVSEQIVQAKPRQKISVQQVASDLNASITQMNETLAQYQERKQQLEEQWKAEDRVNPPGGHLGPDSKDRRKARRDKALLEIKREVFENYREQYAQLHAGEVGSLLQTHAVMNSSNFNKLNKQAGKLLGFMGLEEKALRETQDFPLLTPIDAVVAKQAMDEGISRTNTQVWELLEKKRAREREEKDYLAKIKSNKFYPGLPANPSQIYREQLREARKKSLRDLIGLNLPMAGKVLFNNPQYTGEFCQVAQNLSESERNRMALETGGYIVLGLGLTATAIATGGISIPFVAAAVAVGVADSSYQNSEARRKRRQQEAMLNSYLAQVKDDQSIEQIRGKWIEALESERYGLLGLGLIPLDFTGIGRGARGVRGLVRLTKGPKGFNPRLARNDQLLKLIAGDRELSHGLEVMMKQYSREDVGRLLDDISKFSPKEQREVLAFLSRNEANLGAVGELNPNIQRAIRTLTPEQVLKGKEDQVIRTLTPDGGMPQLIQADNALLGTVQSSKSLTVEKGIELARGAHFKKNKEEILWRAAESIKNLSADDAIKLADQTQNHATRGLIFSRIAGDRPRKELAQAYLGRSLTKEQGEAVQRAHEVGRGQLGENGRSPAGLGNYTKEHLAEKVKILKEAGFRTGERGILIRKGVVGESLLSVKGAIKLANAAHYKETADEILLKAANP